MDAHRFMDSSADNEPARVWDRFLPACGNRRAAWRPGMGGKRSGQGQYVLFYVTGCRVGAIICPIVKIVMLQ